MFRILIVEDVLHTLEELCSVLQEEFPTALVEMASTVEEGSKKIAIAASSNQPFDFAILDFNLPARKGENPEINESLCREIKSKMPETLVMHITAFHEDPAVIKHIALHHARPNTPRAEIINKTDNTGKTGSWVDKLLSEIKTNLIDRQLVNLFGRQADMNDFRADKKHGGSLTHKLATLGRDITAYWHDLDDPIKTKIQEYFDVSANTAPVRATLRLRK
jgi:CheY-like chemotaxis protein